MGTVEKVVFAWSQSFDGVVVATEAGDRFVDAPEVRRIAHDDATEDDRAAAVTQLKIAFVEDAVDVDELERRIELAHAATMLSELDALVADLL